MAEELGLDEGRGEGGEVDGEEGGAKVLYETLGGGVEGDGPRHADGLRHELLARAGGAQDQRGQVGQAPLEGPAVAPEVVGEDGLPDRLAQGRDGGGGAENAAEYEVERASHLEARGEEVGDRAFLGGGQPGQREQPGEILVEALVDRRGRCGFVGVHDEGLQLPLVGVVEQEVAKIGPDLSLTLRRLGARGEGGAKLGCQVGHPRGDAEHIRVGGCFGIGPEVPGLAGVDEVLAEHAALEVHALPAERVHVCQVADRSGEPALLRGHPAHVRALRMYTKCIDMICKCTQLTCVMACRASVLRVASQ